MPRREENPEEAAKQPDPLGLRLLNARTVLVMGQVDPEMAERVIAQLLILDAESHEPIKVMITSNGGHVESGLAIHDVMRYIESDIITIGAGWVASIAVPIMFGAEKKKRYCLPNTRFLLHQPSGGAGGQAADIRIAAQQIIKIRERLNELISKETGTAIEKVAADSDRDYWMNAEEAIKYGLISKIINSASEVG